MIVPYAPAAQMASVNEAFSLSANCPWGFAHNGIDFAPAADLAPFQAVSAGSIETVELSANDITGNWQVNVVLRVNAAYSVVYAFEPLTPVPADGQTQRALIQVGVGQTVSAGDPIGQLLSSQSPGAHVHFHLAQGNTSICPDPHFTPGARSAILTLLNVAHPGALLCYE